MDFKPNSKLTKSVRLSLRELVLCFVLLTVLLVVPSVSYANIFTELVSSLFSPANVSAQSESIISESKQSSQSMPLLEAANTPDLTPKAGSDITIVGEDALLSESGPSTDAPDKVDTSNGQISIYTVRSGDTLAEIAKMYDVSVNTILWANDMTKSSTLKVGQTLVILPISGVMHKVVSGDTLSTIAKKYGGDVEEIASFNDLKAMDKLFVGDRILIPDGQFSSSIRPSSVTSSSGSLAIKNTGPSYDGYYKKPFVGGTRTQGIHGYNAVDYGMPVGSPLYAAAGGKVIIAKGSGWNGGYGDYIVIQHSNNTQTLYGHMSQVSVSVGQQVNQGQLIGYSGNTGRSTGPHLHFEVRGAKNPF